MQSNWSLVNDTFDESQGIYSSEYSVLTWVLSDKDGLKRKIHPCTQYLKGKGNVNRKH